MRPSSDAFQSDQAMATTLFWPWRPLAPSSSGMRAPAQQPLFSRYVGSTSPKRTKPFEEMSSAVYCLPKYVKLKPIGTSSITQSSQAGPRLAASPGSGAKGMAVAVGASAALAAPSAVERLVEATAADRRTPVGRAAVAARARVAG